ncbi:KH domain-containing protein [Zea mays]|uniref:KH domain-containing protein n=1 Tax=Zea mays TaxID=4577 RepID=A0A1D6PX78_MAIZE|nr:KH domain-containing protein [Zea mays]
MADADDAPPTPPPEVVAPEEHPAVAESAVAAQQEGAATAQVDNKRKLEEAGADAEANGTGEDAKRPRVDGEPDAATGIEQQNDGSSVNVSVNVEEPAAAEEDKVAPTDGAATDGDNDTAAPATDSQAGSDDKPLEAAAEAPQPESDAAAVAQEISRMIEVPNSRVGVLIGKAGETIRNLQMSSGAKIQITKDADADSNALTRPVELVGTLGSVDKAELLIKSVIAEAEAGGSPALIARGFGSGQPGSEQFEMTVPDNKVGLIIGKGGDAIKGMQTKSGARIQLIPQHPPEGVTLTERIVRVTGNKKQIELAKDLIKQAMNQTFSRHTNQSGGYGPQGYRPQGQGAASQWGPRSQNHGYGYPPRGMPPPQNYNTPYGSYPPQQGPPRGGMGWDQRQGPPPHPSYQGGASDYYKQGSQPYDSQPPSYPPGPGNYNSYGQSQGPNYGQPQYPQHAPQQNYSHGYGDPRYNAPPPNQQYYGQPPMGPQQGYPQQPDPYARPPYSGPGQWPPSTLLLMGKRTVQQLDLMDMLNRVTHSRVGRHQLHMVRVHQQLQAILSSKVAMHSTHRPNQHMVSKQLKPMRAMGTRELQQILTMEVPTHSQDMVLLVRLLVRLVMPPQQPASLRMARQDTPSRLQILQVMSSLRHQQQPTNPQQPAAAKGVSPQPGGGAAAYGAGGQWTA